MPVWLIFELGRGRVISHEEIAANEGPYPVFSSQTENDGRMGSINTFDFDGDYLTWTTDGANAGTVFERCGKFNCTNVCGALRVKPAVDIDLGFARAAVQIATSYFVRQDINPKLMDNVMAGIRMPVPPKTEQARIAELLKRSESEAIRVAAQVEAGIRLLHERRAALISAAVTGKIDVRNYIPHKTAAPEEELYELA